MDNPSEELAAAIKALVKLNVDVRIEPLAGNGGLCRLRGRPVVFVDALSDLATQLGQVLSAMAEIPGIENIYLPESIREKVNNLRGPAEG